MGGARPASRWETLISPRPRARVHERRQPFGDHARVLRPRGPPGTAVAAQGLESLFAAGRLPAVPALALLWRGLFFDRKEMILALHSRRSADTAALRPGDRVSRGAYWLDCAGGLAASTAPFAPRQCGPGSRR